MPSFLLLALLAAQQPPDKPHQPKPFEIVDNSFLVEEAFNQEPKIFQNIVNWTRQQGDWLMTFTQEWPAPGVRDQLSFTIPFGSVDGTTAAGDVLFNYRRQVLEEGPGRPAFSPRISVQLPTGSEKIGAGTPGIQTNLPFSKQQGDFYFHWNAGFTWLRGPDHTDLWSPTLAGSTIYRLRPMINLMLESVLAYVDGEVAPGRAKRIRSFTLAPGIRGGWNLTEDKQIVIGASAPTTWTEGQVFQGVFGYFSYEGPFKK